MTKKSSKAEVIKALDEAGIDYPVNANVVQLRKLLFAAERNEGICETNSEDEDECDETVVNNIAPAAVGVLEGANDDNLDEAIALLEKRRKMLLLQRELRAMEEENTGGIQRLSIVDVDCIVPKFSGDNAYPVEKWLLDFENAVKIDKKNDHFKFMCMRRLLTGTASIFLRTSTASNYSELKEGLLKQFKRNVSNNDVYRELYNRHRLPNESIICYMLSMKEIAAQGNLGEDEVVSAVIEGLRDNTAYTSMLYTAKNLDDLQDLLIKYDKKRVSDRVPRFNNQRTSVPANSTTSDVRCFNCSQYGHIANLCKQPKRAVGSCFRCGSKDHILKDCKQPSNKKTVNAVTDGQNVPENIYPIESFQTRIMDSAEQAALSELDAQSSHSSAIANNQHYDARRINEYNSDGKLAEGARHMDIRFMRRFERLPVNLSLSSILVPNGVSLDESDVKAALQWSSHLDPLFQNNLEQDPALSWQYFGSSTGFLRRFPGTAWPPEGSKGSKQINDFRTQNWFVQAASSPKDIMILLDSSSGISEKTFDLATETAYNILDTLGENDYVNLITFSDVVKTPVPCFKDRMVRATPDNTQEIKAAVKAIKLEEKANFTAGLEYAFSLLHKYNQSGEGSQCNQAIMLITESTSDSHKEIIKQYNWPHMPVRIFTYLIGSDSGSRSNLHEMACSNKGFFVQINDMEDARRKVIDYALVLARPMIMYQADHPVHWSPVFVAGKSGGLGRDSDYHRRLVTTVSTPVFDRRNHSVRVANLLGVVGTDVPIEEIRKMIPQHKLGPNGYSFIVDNNGRVLYHPDLRPLSDGNQYVDQLRPKYTSVDITELELPETEMGNDHEAVEMNKDLLYDMRSDMVMPKEGETEFTVLNHFDEMKRVTARTQRYFYGPIEDTPFTLAVVLPEKYGSHELNSQQEIRHSRKNVTEYFKGNSWRVHPDWVYCEYNSVSDMEKERENSGEFSSSSRDQEPSFGSPEEQVLHFLARAGRPGWKWMSVRPKSPQPQHNMHAATPVGGHYAQHPPNNQISRKAEPYYCDRTLIQSLVRDAMVTDGLDRNSTGSSNGKEEKQQGYQKFVVATSFVATRSGLLRWIDHIKRAEDTPEPHFSEDNARAIDMSWYKRAVDQHAVEQDSFVYSVPFGSGYSGKSNATLVTATHAVFVEHHGHKAHAAVVGLQFQHESLAKHFINITSACTGMTGCKRTCASDNLDCYVLDNSGFVIISEEMEHTGKFFGQIDGTIMDSLVQDRIYKRITVNDFQGICSDSDNPYAAAGGILQPHRAMSYFFKYLVSLSATWISLLPMPIRAWPQEEYSYTEDLFDEQSYPEEYDEYNSPVDEEMDEFFTTADVEHTTPPPKQHKPHLGPRSAPDPHHARRCDLRTDLYMLQPERLSQGGQNNPLKGKLTNCHVSGCERPFSVQKIPHSNLILLVVDTLCPCGSKQLDIEPLEEAGVTGACSTRRQSQETQKRRRPKKCINYHPEEIEIQQCGRGAIFFLTPTSIIISHVIMLLATYILTNA